jgi:hypothetical protein
VNKLDGIVWSYTYGKRTPQKVTAEAVRSASSVHPVETFEELVAKTAELCFRNGNWFLLYRGQALDYLTGKGMASLFPTIYKGRD